MRKPDDYTLTPLEYARVRAEAERALKKADALGRLPTPVEDIMLAAGVEEPPEDLLNEDFIARMRQKAGDALKRAVRKVMGLFDARARLVFVDRSLYSLKQKFVRLHETAHGFIPWQRGLYAVVEECDQSLDPDVADQFDREANVFASEVLFQLNAFSEEAEGSEFGIRVPMNLSGKYGASIYASIRQYVSKNWRTCVVLVLEPPEFIAGDGFRAAFRRCVPSSRFLELFSHLQWKDYYTPDDEIGALIPLGKQRMTGKRSLVLSDCNGCRHECVAEAFTNTHQVFILIHATKTLTATTIILPSHVVR